MLLDDVDFPSLINLSVDPMDAIMFADDSAYYGDDKYMTNSKFNAMNDDIHKFAMQRAGYDTEKQLVDAFVTGRYAHVCAFEPEKRDEFRVYDLGKRPYKNNPLPESGKWRKAFEDTATTLNLSLENAYDWVISTAEEEMYSAMADCFWQGDGNKDMWGDADFEQAFVSYDPFDLGIPVKGKLDIVKTDGDRVIIGDLKTTSKTVDDFIYSIGKFNYDAQAAMYMELTGADEFHLLPVSKVNFAVADYVIKRDSKTFERGLAKYKRSAMKFKRLFIDGEYSPSFVHKVELD